MLDRKYVIVSMCHKGIANGGALLFWGVRTEDDQKRSFGGYTSNLDTCEIYTKEEIVNSSYKFPFYKKGYKPKKDIDYAIPINELENFGRKMTIIYR